MSNNNKPLSSNDLIDTVKSIVKMTSNNKPDANIIQTRMLYNIAHLKARNYTANSPICPECGYCPTFDTDDLIQKLAKYYDVNLIGTDMIEGIKFKFKYTLNYKNKIIDVDTAFLFMKILKVNHCEKCKTWIGYYRYHNIDINIDKDIKYCIIDENFRQNDINAIVSTYGEKFLHVNTYWILNDMLFYDIFYQKGDDPIEDIIQRKQILYETHSVTLPKYVSPPRDGFTLFSFIREYLDRHSKNTIKNYEDIENYKKHMAELEHKEKLSLMEKETKEENKEDKIIIEKKIGKNKKTVLNLSYNIFNK